LDLSRAVTIEGTVAAYLGLGSNLGDRRTNLLRAVEFLLESIAASREAIAVASLYETSPVGHGCEDHPVFLNSAIRVETVLSPRELLLAIQRIESRLGRVRSRPAEPRTTDIDILLYGPVVLYESDLIIPHPRLHERCFVLDPLSEIAAGIVHPVSGKSIKELARLLRDSDPYQNVQKTEDTGWWNRSI
jgi:2-amino-4-hydroxy-6-hydroxymethyldihydropteridine diphosphokinase